MIILISHISKEKVMLSFGPSPVDVIECFLHASPSYIYFPELLLLLVPLVVLVLSLSSFTNEETEIWRN